MDDASVSLPDVSKCTQEELAELASELVEKDVPFVWSCKYGIKTTGRKAPHDRDIELCAFRERLQPPQGLGTYEHLKRFMGHLWPHAMSPDYYHPWTERIHKALCDEGNTQRSGKTTAKAITLVGCGAAGKTHSVAMFACAWWMASPHNSMVVITSTTKEMIGVRVWPVIQHYFDTAVDSTGHHLPWGHKAESENRIKWVDSLSGSPSKKYAISALAVAHGETQKAAHNLRGMHADRIMLIIDEANGTPEAIFETIPNMRKGCTEFLLVVIGNPISRLDNHGVCAKPVGGYGTVGVDTLEWQTEGVHKWRIPPGVCLRFDGAKSPNVVAGEDKWPFIYSNASWEEANNALREKTLSYWSQDRGFWPPDGFCDTVFSETLVVKHNGDEMLFKVKPTPIAFLDPAFGGDNCIIQFGLMGRLGTDKEGVLCTDTVPIQFEGVSDDERDYVIARQVISECQARGVAPTGFGLDATGIGRGVRAIIAGEWSQAIRSVGFGESATERPSSTADRRPAREVYADRVTEMWWSAREFLEAGQLKNIPKAAVIEFCSREYRMSGKRYRIESKQDFKKRFGSSPDYADAVAGLVDVARFLGAYAQTPALARSGFEWQETVEHASDMVPFGADYSTSAIDVAFGQL